MATGVLSRMREQGIAGFVGGAANAMLLIALGASTAAAQQPATNAAPKTIPGTHTVKRGDTLWDLAKLYLGDPFQWPAIYRLNTDRIEDPHWIYPGEVITLPGGQAAVVGVTPPVSSLPTPPPAVAPMPPATAAPPPPVTPSVTPAPMSAAPANSALPTPPATVVASPDTSTPMVNPLAATVRMSEYVAAPWVDAERGPRGAGYIIQSVDIPGIAQVRHAPIQLYDRVFISPPAGAVAPEHELYLAYTLGPLLEAMGRVVIPTAVLEVTQPPRHGEAATARVVRMFGQVDENQQLIPIDTAAALAVARPAPVDNGKQGKIRWILHEPVLPTTEQYVVLDLTARDGLTTGDVVELYQPRKGPTDGRPLTLPEVSIARAQVMRVTPYGASAIIVSQEQPKIVDGTPARIAAKMPSGTMP